MILTFQLIAKNNGIGSRNGLDDFLDKIRGRRSDSISSVEFEIHEIEREPVVKEVLEIYSAKGTYGSL